MYLSSVGNVLLLAFGFGFVIFWHELGHFLAAKWADVKVEQFAVGFGQALFSWRKGLGLRWGSTQTEYQAKLREQVERTLGSTLQFKEQADGATDAQLSAAGQTLGLSDTEYRLNWIPLGGYVKMLGQDDLRPGADAPDPRSYTSKPVSKRMVIVSAGVTMNVILAAIGFMVLFKVGYRVTSATVGNVLPGSPASMAYHLLPGDKHQVAPIMPGDTIERIDGRWQADDFDKIKLNTPLLIPGEAVPIVLLRADGKTRDTVWVAPQKPTPDAEFPLLGIAPAQTLAALELTPEVAKIEAQVKGLQLPEITLIRPGDTIVEVDGKPVVATQRPDRQAADRNDYFKLIAALQARGGLPLPVKVKRADGKVEAVSLPAHFEERFGADAVDFAGLQMLPRAIEVSQDSLFKGLIQPGDVVVDVADPDPSGGHQPMPNKDELFAFAHAAAAAEGRLQMTVLRGGKRVVVGPVQFDRNHINTGVAFDYADGTPVVADPTPDSAADAARVPAGAVLRTVDGHPVRTWFDVWAAMKNVPTGRPVPLTAAVDGQERPFTLRKLEPAEVAAMADDRLSSYGLDVLQPAMTDRKARSLAEAGEWGLGETRDAIVQVYLTVRAMFRGGISPKELSGPVGILAVGYKFAQQSATRLLWFLSIISANLAVMNFLPIPVVDGGLFTFLIIEKLKGSPISQRTQVIAQYAGLTLLLSIFLFATWQDVFRIGTLFHG